MGIARWRGKNAVLMNYVDTSTNFDIYDSSYN